MTFTTRRDPYKKPQHMAALINNFGGVSALCFKRPRAIDLKVAGWTLQERFVTCKNCLKRLAEKAVAA